MDPAVAMLLKAAVDLVAAFLLTYVLFYRRYKNKELFVSAMLLNIFVFSVMAIISDGNIGLQAGLGLFAILSILRFRSETFTKMEMTYFFGAVALAAVNGIATIGPIMAGVNLLILLGTYFIDHEVLLERTEMVEVRLDEIPPYLFSNGKAAKELSKRFKIHVKHFSVKEVDYVKETAVLELHYVRAHA